MFGIAENKEFLTAIGIADVPEEQKVTLIAGLEDLAQKKLTVKIAGMITEEQANEFNAIADDKQAYDWVMKNIPNFQDVVASVLEDIKNDILARKAKVIG